MVSTAGQSAACMAVMRQEEESGVVIPCGSDTLVQLQNGGRVILWRLRRGEEHKNFQFFANVEKAVFDLGSDENYAASFYHLFLRSNLHARPTSYYVVNLVFVMRFLRVGPAGRQNVNPDAEHRNAHEFPVSFPGLGTLGGNRGQIVECLH